jgi:GTP-binding protein Era
MNQDARLALNDADAALLILDGSTSPAQEDHIFGDILNEAEKKPPIIMALNKVDKLKPDQIQKRVDLYREIYPDGNLLLISALTGENLEGLLDLLIEVLPEGPQLYPEDQITDLYERDIAADMIRAAAMLHLQHELPHVIAVRIDQYQERGQEGAYIEATLFVERESQKGIVIGEGGKMIKKIGSTARKDIEAMSGRRVYLRLRVKVKKNWRNDPNALRLFGFKK